MDQDNKKQPAKKESKQPSKFLRFTTVAIQMGATIWLGNMLGKWLDSKYNKGFLESTVTLLSVFMAMYMVISQVIKVSKEND